MKNYVIAYQFSDSGTSRNFGRELKGRFDKHQEETRHGMEFFALKSGSEPAVEGEIKALLNGKYLGDDDFVTLISDDDHTADQRVRVMMVGHDQNLENRIGGNFSTAEFDSLVTDLLSAKL